MLPLLFRCARHTPLQHAVYAIRLMPRAADAAAAYAATLITAPLCLRRYYAMLAFMLLCCHDARQRARPCRL